MRPIVIDPPDVHPTRAYAHATRAGDLLFISGQVPRRRDETIVDPADVEGQIRQVFENLLGVLAASGGDARSLLKVTTYLTDSANFEPWRRIRAEMLGETRSASTLVVVDSLSFPEYLVEIEAVAMLDGAAG